MRMRPSLLLCACASLLAAGCGDGRPSGGAGIFASWGCTACHGPAGGGTAHGPPLSDLEAHWTEETLSAYIADPSAFAARDERLGDLAKAYPQPMPPFPYHQDARRELARWLLAR